MIIGTRKSRLAITQSERVADAIRKHFPGMDIKLTGCETEGDRQMERSLADFGGKGAFTQEIEMALLNGRIDLAVHSAKDMPLELPDGLTIGAVLRRGDSRDVWVGTSSIPFKERAEGTVVGTGSRRRSIQARNLNTGIVVRDIRGNVPTRLKKLADGKYDGVILAAAGLQRLGYLPEADLLSQNTGSFEAEGMTFYYEYFSTDDFFPAAGQGIIAVESRMDDNRDVLATIHDEETWLCCLAERAFLRGIGGGCNEAAGITATIVDDCLCIRAVYGGGGKNCANDVITKSGCQDRLHENKYEFMRTAEMKIELTQSESGNRRLAEEVGAQIAGQLLGTVLN